MVKIIDGKGLAEKIRQGIKEEVASLAKAGKKTPRLVVVLVGEDPASQVYVRNKERACAEIGIASETLRLPLSIKESELIGTIKKLNGDDSIDGILVQLPLPKGLDERRVLNEIAPNKDVDGLHPMNMGKLLKGEEPPFIPCTPQGCIELILSTGVDICGKEAVVVGRSNIVGKPMAILLLQNQATVTVCHSKTKDLGEVTRRADILVAAIGKPEMIKGNMIKEGAIVIDVGMNRGTKLVGDVAFDEAKEKVAYITPVPGGVGPMTIAMLLKNTVKAARGKERS
ncbi:MAG: bifunctional methylenetetrahydrofolate dehydrogenase/methenyltetrahydrofolate cyclohydrolase FolD [bacterium]